MSLLKALVRSLSVFNATLSPCQMWAGGLCSFSYMSLLKALVRSLRVSVICYNLLVKLYYKAFFFLMTLCQSE